MKDFLMKTIALVCLALSFAGAATAQNMSLDDAANECIARSATIRLRADPTPRRVFPPEIEMQCRAILDMRDRKAATDAGALSDKLNAISPKGK